MVSLVDLVKICGIFYVIFLIKITQGVPRYESNNDHREGSRFTNYVNEKLNDTVTDNSRERIQRLGYTTGYGGIDGYGGSGTGISSYNPIKLDLGGVVLGTLVGIGAILIIPKLVNIFAGNYGHYARSADGELTSISDMFNKIDDILSKNNIDSTSCVQRAVCAYIRSTESKIETGSADQIDDLVHNISGNSLTDYILHGTAVNEAIEKGRNPNKGECENIYNCPIDSNTFKDIISKFLP